MRQAGARSSGRVQSLYVDTAVIFIIICSPRSRILVVSRELGVDECEHVTTGWSQQRTQLTHCVFIAHVYQLVHRQQQHALYTTHIATCRPAAATVYPRPSPPPWAPQRPNRRNVAVVSHAQYVLTVTAAPASRVKAALSKASWVNLTF